MIDSKKENVIRKSSKKDRIKDANVKKSKWQPLLVDVNY